VNLFAQKIDIGLTTDHWAAFIVICAALIVGILVYFQR
jgi:hypothetical protein